MDELESFARKNRILNAIPTSELHRLLALMERVQLYPRQVLERPGGGSEHIHFPIDGVLSMIASTREGDTVEVATVTYRGGRWSDRDVERL